MSSRAKRKDSTSLAHYSPEKGLKTIAVLEAIEKHAARAKDAEKFYQAIEAKLTAQAEFVFWWDTKAQKNPGGRPVKTGDGSVTGFESLERLGLDKKTISRWRKKLNDPVDFQTALEQAKTKCLQFVESQKGEAHVSQNSGENEWYTPEPFIEAARDVLGAIDLDPASHENANATVKAAQIFTAEDDGLVQPWHGRIWMNPPYSQPLVAQFADKLAGSVQAGDVTAAVVLINNATETEWFTTIASVCGAVCFPKGRVRFWSPGKESATPLQGQAVLYAGPETDAFCRRFASFGLVATIVR